MPKVLITVSSNELEASAMLTAEGRRAQGITPQEILDALKAKGVVYGIDETAVGALAESAATASRVCVARGTQPTRGKPAEVEVQFQENALVRAGQTLAILHAAEPAAPGRTVCGKKLPAPKVPERPVPAGENVEFSEEDRTLRACTPGYVATENHRIRVEPLVRLSDDRRMAAVRMYPHNGGAAGLTVADLEGLLREAGVVHGVHQAALQAVLGMLVSADGPTDWCLVAKGSDPIDGEDATLEFLVDAEAHAGLEMEDGRIDYRQRRESTPVTAGDLLVRKRPATAGTPGQTVTGEVLSPRPGQDRDVLVGENVQASPDGLTYTAAIDGMVLRDGDGIRVVNLLEVKGDVDFSTGSLNLEKSGVIVRGAIRSTFSVKAKDTVVVEDSIEDAIVESAADIDVAKGIVQGKLGSVTAGGCVRAAFAQNAEVLAGDSIEIRDSAFHSLLVAKNVVSVRQGKGVLVGGHTVAGQRIEVRVAGSKANTQTVLQVGLDYEAVKTLDQELQSVERGMAKVIGAGGDNLARYAKPGGAAPKDPRIRELLDAWRELEAKKQKLLSKRAGLLEEHAAEMGDDAVIVVGEIAHRGVKMIIGNASLQITDTVHGGGRFMYDSESGGIRRMDA